MTFKKNLYSISIVKFIRSKTLHKARRARFSGFLSLLLIVNIPFLSLPNWVSYESATNGLSSSYLNTNRFLSNNISVEDISLALQPLASLQYCSSSSKPLKLGNCKPKNSFEKFMVKFFITDYLNFHAEEKHNSLSRKLIFRPKPTGIGDRFERLMTAYYVAVVTKRVLLVDWQRPSPIEDLLETAYHGTDLFLRDVDRSEKPGMARSDGGNEFVLDKTQNHDPNKFIDTLNSNITNIVMTMTKRPLRSTLELLGHQRFAHTGKRQLTAFYGSYICRKAVMHRVLRVRTDFFENMSSKGIQLQFKSVQNADNIKSLFKNGYIGVHARVGVGLHEIGDRFDAIQDNLEIPAKCLARRVSRLAAISDALKLPIFLATDTVPFREIFIREVQNMSNGTVEIFHGKWNVLHSYLHIDMEREPLNETQKKINIKTQKMMETYADLAILGNAAHIIALRSSFVRFAFSIGSASSLAQINIENCLAAKISTYT